MTTADPRDDRCPRCESPQPNLHPAMQADGGEVQLCPHIWHTQPDPALPATAWWPSMKAAPMPDTETTSPAVELREAARRLREWAKDIPRPDFYVAVAGWLAERSAHAEKYLRFEVPECTHEDGPCGCDRTPGWSCEFCCEWLGVSGCDCYTAALTVARAYLSTKKGQ